MILNDSQQTMILSSTGDQFSASEDKDGSLVCEGWLSTNNMFPSIGDIRYRVNPLAFSPEIIAEYMAKPIVTWMHNRDGMVTIGKALSLDVIPDKGVRVRFAILPTTIGKDVMVGIRAGAIRSLSFQFAYDRNGTQIEDITEGQGAPFALILIDKIARLLEVAVCDLGQNEEAVFSIDNNQHFSYPAFHAGKSQGVKKMELQEELKAVDTRLGAAETTLASVKDKVNDVARLQAEVAKFRDLAERSQTENREFVSRISDNFKTAIDELKTAQEEVLKRAVPSGNIDEICFSAREAVDLPIDSIKRALTPERFMQVSEFRRLNDQLAFVDLTLMAAKPVGPRANYLRQYQGMSYKERIKDLKVFKKLEKASKAFAMDTSTSNEGSQFHPTGYSSQLIDMVREDAVLAPMHESFRMIQSPQVKPVAGADIMGTLAGETTTVPSSLNTTEQTPGSRNVTFTAKKIRTRIQYSSEAMEDFIINELDYVMKYSTIGQRRAVEKAMINGDKAYAGTMDSGDIPGATDSRYGWDGYRVGIHTNNSSSSIRKVDLSNFSEKNLLMVQKCLGKFAQRPTQHFWLTSLTTYLMHFLNPEEMPNHRTLDKMGPNATILTGQLSAFNAAPVLTSEFVQDTLDETGIYSAAGKTKSIVLDINRQSYQMGQWRDIEAEVVRNTPDDVYDIVTYQRCDFEMVYTIATDIVAAVGHNVSTS